jgi:pimeloyl-ACP methyl ester carboxylesterase
LTSHIGQVSQVLVENDLRNVILVGHSYGGMEITGVAGRVRERIGRLVYLDAALPDPGQSLDDILIRGLAGVPGSRSLFPGQSPPYVEKLTFDPGKYGRPKRHTFSVKGASLLMSRGIAGKKLRPDRTGPIWRSHPRISRWQICSSSSTG